MQFRLLSVYVALFGVFIANALPTGLGFEQGLSHRDNSTQIKRDVESIGELFDKRAQPAKKPSARCKAGAGTKKAPSPAKKKSKRDDVFLFRRNVDSSTEKYWKAVGDLGAACDAAGIRYALIGGTACAAYGNPRTTQDIDIIVPDDKAINTLLTSLSGRLSLDCNTYLATMDGIEVDLFDAQMWPQRPEYKTHLDSTQTVKTPKTNQNVKVLSVQKLLEEKRRSAADRKDHKKGPNDNADVQFLEAYIKSHA